jgi:hypothetical protein
MCGWEKVTKDNIVNIARQAQRKKKNWEKSKNQSAQNKTRLQLRVKQSGFYPASIGNRIARIWV